MSDLVSSQDIERIVGAARGYHVHYARAVSSEQTVYILHSRDCLDSRCDLRDCRYSLALNRGICEEDWSGFEDVAVVLAIQDGRLIPVRGTEIKGARA